MGVLHKHRGILTKTGHYRPHPIQRMHKDAHVQKWHNEEISSKSRTANKKLDTTLKKKTSKAKILSNNKTKKKVQVDVKICDVDKDGYINVNLITDKIAKGLRVKFERTEGRTKRTVGLQIEK